MPKSSNRQQGKNRVHLQQVKIDRCSISRPPRSDEDKHDPTEQIHHRRMGRTAMRPGGNSKPKSGERRSSELNKATVHHFFGQASSGRPKTGQLRPTSSPSGHNPWQSSKSGNGTHRQQQPISPKSGMAHLNGRTQFPIHSAPKISQQQDGFQTQQMQRVPIKHVAKIQSQQGCLKIHRGSNPPNPWQSEIPTSDPSHSNNTQPNSNKK